MVSDRIGGRHRQLRHRRICADCSPAYEVVPVVDVVVVDDDAPPVLVVGPPALSADTARAMPNPARPSVATINVVFLSKACALRTPAGLPGISADESANALDVESASDNAKQAAFFIS